MMEQEIVKEGLPALSGATRHRPHAERVKIEEDLVLFKTLINQSNDAILIANPETSRILYVNDKVSVNLGYSRDELLGMRIIDIGKNVEDMEAWRELVRAVKANCYALFETEQRRKDGTTLPVEINVRYISHDGRDFMVSVVRDITERRQAAEALIAEKNKLAAVLAALNDGITVQDREFRVLYQNALHREKQGDHFGEQCYRAFHQRESACDNCLLLECFRDGKVRRRETTAMTDKGLLHLEVTASPLKDSRGAIIAGIEVVRDVTERKKLETRLVQAQKMEAVGQLAGGVAHDFNNILTAIMGYGDILKMNLPENDPMQADVNRILTAAERAANLTQSLLAFSRRQVIRIKSVDLNEIVARVEELLRRIIGEDVELTTELFGGALVIMADTSQMEQVLMNLATNARDAMPGGGRLSIRTDAVNLDEEFIRAHGYGHAGRYALLEVRDTGTGMDEMTLASIFEPFFTTKEVGRGTGLGLSIVYGVMKQHSGYVTVRSRPGAGAVFQLFFPLSAGAVEQTPVPAPVQVPAQGTETVLVAEDNADVRRLARTTLERFGYTVIEAADGEEAVRKFREAPAAVDLLVLDVIMPKKNGKDALEEIRSIAPKVQAIFISGYTADIVDREGMPEAGIHFIAKPFSTDKLLGMVRTALDERLP